MSYCIDVDLENIVFPTQRESETKENENSSSSSQPQSKRELKSVEESFDPEDHTNKFKIKNFDLAKNFMKGRQCGRESTPARSKKVKQTKNKLAKIKANIPKAIRDMKKAWDEDNELSSSITGTDKVENFEAPKMEKIVKISMIFQL